MSIIRIENWYVGCRNPYMPPDAESEICGQFYGHPTVLNGHHAFPSRPVAGDANLMIFRGKSGRFYQLGDPDPKYLEAYPNAIYFVKKFLDGLLPLDFEQC